jgi:putative ABC transport system substrate-binding protein
MRRREFITLLGGAVVMRPLAAGAQQREPMRRIGVLLPAAADDPDYQAWVGAFLQALAQSGWTIGRNVRIDTRWAPTNAAIRKHAAELAALAPDVILAHGAGAVGPLLQATRTVPIVFPVIADPVAAGYVDSLARPGGNSTGFMLFENTISGKWLELLKQIAPGVARVAVAVTAFARGSNGGLIVTPSTPAQLHRELIITLAGRHKLPAVYFDRPFVVAGGLVSYGPDRIEMYRQAAGYVDRILKGEKPADLPVQAPTKYATVLNLKTAKALGLEVPPTLLATADEVIE